MSPSSWTSTPSASWGWHATWSKHTDLMLHALRMGTWTRAHADRPITDGVIHHSDAGTLYVRVRYVERLALEGLVPSVGSVGDANDNALMETVVGLDKAECIDTTVFHLGAWINRLAQLRRPMRRC